MRPLLIGCIICLNFQLGHAQWSKQDSIWLQNVLEGKDTIRLNPEFQKAIESGSLINSGQPVGKMQMAPSSIPITKDFSPYLDQKEDSARRKVALKDLPPSVFWWYDPKVKLPTILQSIADEIRRRPISAPAGQFDLGKMTSRKEYVHARNAERDGTWRNYNNLPTEEIMRKRNDFNNLPTPDIIRRKKDPAEKQLMAVADSAKRDSTLIRKDTALIRRDTLAILKP